MKSKLLICAILVLGLTGFLQAQQDPMYSQYMFNHQVINPAYAGSWGYMTSNILYRKQWVGMHGAPETGAFSFHLPSSNDRHGFGMTLLNDRIGVSQMNSVSAAYALRIHLGPKARLAFGLQGSLDNFRANFGGVRTGSTIDPSQNPSDPAFNGNSVNLWLPNAGAGVFFHTKHFYAGVSTPRLVMHGIATNTATSLASLSRHFFFTTGVVIGADDAVVKFKPSILAKYVPGTPMQFDFNAHVLFVDRIWVGASYRTDDAIVGMLQIQVLQWLRVGYAYDYITSELSQYNSGSHEFLLGVDLNFKRKGMMSPRYF